MGRGCVFRKAVAVFMEQVTTKRTSISPFFSGCQPLFLDQECPKACQELPAREELFDLLQDPTEEVDLLRGNISQQVRRTLRRFRSAMAEHQGLTPQFRVDPEAAKAAKLDPELEASLRALGYL